MTTVRRSAPNKSGMVVAKSQWGWTATDKPTGKEVAHSHDKALLLDYLKGCVLDDDE